MPVPSPRNSIRIARGDYADLEENKQVFGDGEILYAADQDRFYTAQGGELFAVGAGIVASESIDALNDVDTSTDAPVAGQILGWNGTSWIPVNETDDSYDDTALTTRVTQNEADIASLDSRASFNEGSIATNATDISTNATDISTNTTDILTNATDISTNATDISTNTTDISTNATAISTNATAISTKADLVDGVVPTSQIPAIAITEFLGDVADQAAMLALSGQKGDWCNRTDAGLSFVITGTDPTQASSWTDLVYPAAPVTSVNTMTGTVVLSAADVGAIPSTDAPSFAPNTLDLQGVTDNGSTTTLGATFGGNVGIGLTSASTALHVKSTSGTQLTLERDGSGDQISGVIFKDGSGDQNRISSSDSNLLFETGASNTESMRIDSSGNVGIGTISPDVQLHVNEPSGAHGKIKLSNTEGSGIIGTNSNVLYFEADRYFLYDDTGNDTYLAITNSGNVGIGTSSPSAKVHITNNSNSSTQYLNSDADLLVNAAGTKGAVLKLTNGGSSTESAIVFDQSSILKFTAREYERMRIDSSGRLLVGTTTEGAANEADNVTISGTGDVGITLRSTNSAINRIYFSDGTSGTSEYAGYQLYNHSSNAMIFGTNAIERMRIDSSGNVGIGGTATGNFGAINKGVLITGTNAAVGLRVETSHSSSGILEMYAESGGSVLDTRGSGHIRFASAGTEFIRIDSSGRLLVGTSSAPAGTDAQYSRLAIRGNTINDNACYLSLGNKKTTANTTSDDNLGIITFNDSDSDAGEYARIVGASDGTNGTNDYPGKLIFSTTEDGGSSPTERMRIDSSGRLLVGTTTVGEDYADELTIANNSNCGITIRSSSSTSGNLYFSDGTSGSAQYSGAIVYSHGTNSLKLFTNGGQERMRIDAGGDVAIGMTPAGKSLSIQHAANPTLGFYTGNTLRGELNITTGETSLRSYANSPITFEVGSERMRINSAGSLLVGTSTTSSFPDRLISVGHHTRASSYIDIRSSTVAALLFADGTSGDAAYRGQVEYHHSTDSMRFWTGANERMRIDSTGSVKVPGIYSQALSGTLRSVVARNDGYLGYNSSTRASKTNINSLDNINWLYQLNPVEFNYRKTDSETNAYTEENYEEKEYGLIAEEVETIAPDLCFYDETQEGEVLAGVHYRKMSALLLKAIQNLKADNETFQLRIAALEQRLSDAGIA